MKNWTLRWVFGSLDFLEFQCGAMSCGHQMGKVSHAALFQMDTSIQVEVLAKQLREAISFGQAQDQGLSSNAL